MNQAYIEGQEARKAGRNKGSNPYAQQPRNPNTRLWNMGWTAENREQKTS